MLESIISALLLVVVTASVTAGIIWSRQVAERIGELEYEVQRLEATHREPPDGHRPSRQRRRRPDYLRSVPPIGAALALIASTREWAKHHPVPAAAILGTVAVIVVSIVTIPPLLDGPEGEPFDVPRGGGEATPTQTPTLEPTSPPAASTATTSVTTTPTPTVTGSPTASPTASPTPPEPTLTPSPSPPPSPTPSPTQTEPSASPTPTFSPPSTPTPTRPPTPTPTPTQRDCVKLPLGDDDDDLCVDEDGYLACLRLPPVAERLCLLNLDDLGPVGRYDFDALGVERPAAVLRGPDHYALHNERDKCGATVDVRRPVVTLWKFDWRQARQLPPLGVDLLGQVVDGPGERDLRPRARLLHCDF